MRAKGQHSILNRVWWHQPLFLFIIYIFFLQYIHSYIHSLRVHSCFLIALRSVEGLPGVPSRDSTSGLPYSKPAHYFLSCAAHLAFNFYCKEWLSLFGPRSNLEDFDVVFVLIVKESVSECVCGGGVVPPPLKLDGSVTIYARATVHCS